MSSIDERVVQMKFDNGQFAKGVADTRGALDKLKQGLNLDSATKSLDGLDAAGKRFSLAGIAQGVSDLSQKFSAMSIIGITALTNITNKAINAGMAFANSFTMQPIMDGFNEYEQKMGSIQTILANTARHGTGLDEVKASLEELNAYSDKTIYNFGDMTRNIGMFTNAGIKLEDATAMIKGFSNEAAMSGTNAQQAAGAAYQLSQAMSKGKVTLEDWRSLTNASMGNKNMQLGLIDIAKAMGTLEKAGVSAESVQKDFNGTLEKGWLSADVMTTYLKIQAGEMDAAAMKQAGLTDAQIDNFLKMQKIAEESATKVRTWTQLIGTLKESIGSSWATTFELLLGDFNEATELFTNVNDTLGGMIGKVGEARNNLIKGWVEAGGRTELISGISAAFNALVSVMKVAGDAWRSVFPPITVDTLTSLTGKLTAFLKGLQPSAETLNKLSRIFKGLFSIMDIGWTTVMLLWGVFQRLFSGLGPASAGLLELIARFGDFITKLAETYKNSDKVHAFFVGLTPILKAPGQAINWLVEQLVKLWDKLKMFKLNIDTSGFATGFNNLQAALAKLKPTGDAVHKVWNGVVEMFKKVLDIGKQLGRELGEFFSRLAPEISNGFANINWGVIMGMLGTGLLASIALMIKKFTGGGLIQQIKDAFFGDDEEDDGPGFLDRIKETLGGVTDTLSQMQTTLKAGTLVAIAAALALMAYSLSEIAKIEPGRIVGALGAMTAMMGQLIGAMILFDRINPVTSIGKLVGLGTSMILLAIAINILTDAVKELGKLDFKELLKGIGAVTALLMGMAVAARIMSTQNGVLVRTGISMILLAAAIKILASAVGDFAGMDWQKMMQGLIGVGAVLGGLVLFTQLAKANKGAVGSAVGLILLGVAIKILASAVSDFAAMDWQKMMQGLVAMGMVLGGLAVFSNLVNPGQMISMGVSLVIIGAAMKIFASALSDLGNLDWQKMMQGLIAMGIIMGGIAIFSNIVNPAGMIIMAASMIVIGIALDQLADVLKKLGGMTWEEIVRGLVALAGSLVIMAGAMYLMSAALPGAAALLVMAAALRIFLPVLQAMGNMSWEQIWTGIGALALSLLTLGVAGAVLGILSPLFLAFGAALLVVGAGALLTGAGMLMMATALTALSVAGAVGLGVLVAGVTALLGLIPYGVTQIGLGIVAFAKVIGENVPTFIEAAVKMLLGFLEGLRKVLPEIVQFVVDMLIKILTTIEAHLPQIVQSGFNILIGFLQGIANNIGRVVTVAVDIIVNFLNGIANNIGRIVEAGANLIVKFLEGIGNNIGKITDAGADLIIKAINAVTNTINTRSGELREAGGKLAIAIADGMTGGMASKAANIAQQAWDLGAKAIASIKSAIDSHSPSKESRKLGAYLGQGFALGIRDLGYMSQRSAGEVGSSALEAMKASIANAGKDLDGGMTMHPTITPVLDLSGVRKESDRIAGMLTLPPLDIMGTYQTAAAVVASQREQARIDAENDEYYPGDEPRGQNITYIQNLNSPKPLSREEIYRGTRNQLSEIKSSKGVLTANAV
ncbi:tape measure protein [Arthrobacter phage Niktson]|uniref:Tape measure protein n=1 Tax=Arthrobacter phage Niktson TaxID=2014347 RepID=A0A218M5J5_9CAUD|nr:tape measure protein [Arthrobacter phage Niktson]ASD52251.1 tape measure protein [Arthrobacter phage Niktson]ASD52344.1 tape measure protein [Arthrobacter phage ElephantMan]